jgi:signal transduction histidine kinase/CheY-like chemotaxis protein
MSLWGARTPLPAAPDPRHGFRERLLHKYMAYFVATVCLALVSNATLEAWFYHHEHRNLLIAIQRAQAAEIAVKINDAFKQIESQIGWTTGQGWDERPSEAWRFDFARLLRQASAIAAIAKIDAGGREHLRQARHAPLLIDNTDTARMPGIPQAGASKVHYGPVEWRGATKVLKLSIADPDGGASIADIDLKFIFEAAGRAKLIDSGRVYLLDASNRLIFHSHPQTAGPETVFAGLDQVQAARAALPVPERDTYQDPTGRAVLSASAAVAPLDWLVFVELPVTAADAPLLPLYLRSGVHLALALLLAVVAGILLARRMAGPIEDLRAGAARVGAGDLAHRIDIESRDELGALGDQFNRMTAQLQDSYATLEAKVDARTHELAVANLAKSRFLAAASHDLRQPLHALGLFVAELRAQKLPSEGRHLVGRIDAAVAAMNELFGALLDISKLDAGVLATCLVDFPVDHLFSRIETTFAAAARDKGLSLRVIASGAYLRSDAILLERILLNLVANALRYTARGRIVLGCRRRGENVCIEVWDTGPGIAVDRQQEVFAEFAQLGPPEQRHPDGGLGLGLAIVDRLGRLLQHRVTLRSIPGKGSCFSIEVPLATAPRSTAAALPASFELPLGKLVAVIDDDALVLESMAGLMRSWGCIVVTASNAAEAAARLAGDRPSLIVSDYHLSGGMTGIAAIEQLRALFQAPIAAFLVSADVAADRSVQARASGHQLLQKPVRPMVLRAMIMEMLRGA